MSAYKGGNPWAQVNRQAYTFSGWVRRQNARDIKARRGGTTAFGGGIPRYRMAAGDPSWLSSFLKSPLKSVAAIGKTALDVFSFNVPGLIGDVSNVGNALGIRELTGAPAPPKTGGARLSGMASTSAVPYMGGTVNSMFRPTATAAQGKAAGMTSGLAPLPPLLNRMAAMPGRIASMMSDPFGTQDPFGGSTDTTDPGGGDYSGTNGVVAIPSSGGGSMLWHHFFGKSNSKAIPVAQTNGMRPSGYHINKHGYYLSSIATWLPPGTVWVKGRRRNPLNPRALHRSMARLISAKHAVRKLGLLEVPRHRAKKRAFLVPRGRSVKMLKA